MVTQIITVKVDGMTDDPDGPCGNDCAHALRVIADLIDYKGLPNSPETIIGRQATSDYKWSDPPTHIEQVEYRVSERTS